MGKVGLGGDSGFTPPQGGGSCFHQGVVEERHCDPAAWPVRADAPSFQALQGVLRDCGGSKVRAILRSSGNGFPLCVWEGGVGCRLP